MAKKKNIIRDFGGLVYSTDPDYRPDSDDIEESSTLPPKQQNLRIHLIRHKGNKVTTTIREFVGAEEDLQALGKMLKQAVGSGGSVKDGEILIQGDKRKEIGAKLEKEGYKFKFAGG